MSYMPPENTVLDGFSEDPKRQGSNLVSAVCTEIGKSPGLGNQEGGPYRIHTHRIRQLVPSFKFWHFIRILNSEKLR